MLRSEAAVGGVIRLSTVTEPDVPWQVQFADPSKDPQLGLEQREQTLRSVLVHVTPGILFLRVIHERVHVALQGSIAARRVGVEPPPRLDGEVSRLLDRLDREIPGRLEDDRPLATHPRDNSRPVFVIMPSTGLALLATPTCVASQRLRATAWRLPLAARGVVEVIRFHRALQLALGFVGHGRIPQPPAPAIAGPAMDPQLPGNASRRTRQAQQEGRQNPVHA
jgi:hypothetical protein